MLNQVGAHWANQESDMQANYDMYGFGSGIQRLVESKLKTKGRGKVARGMQLDQFKKMIVLGRNIQLVDVSAAGTGVDVLFVDGDQCNADENYSTEIRYRCILADNKGKDVADDFSAEKLEYVGTEGSECRHVFAWHTNLACPVCRRD